MLPKPLARRVVTAARRFQDREPWLEFTDEFLFAFEIPGELLPIYAIVLGAAGKEFGLSMYLGERALEQVHHVTRSPRPPFIAPMLLLSFDPIGSVAPEFRELAQLAGAEGRVIPMVMSIAVGGKSEPASPAKLRLVAQVVEAMLLAFDNDLLRPRVIDLQRGGKVLTLTATGEASRVNGVTARFVGVAPLSGQATAPATLPSRLTELPLIDTHWVVGFEPSPLGVTDAPNRPWLLFVVDPAVDRIVGLQLVPLDDPDDLDQAVHAFARILASPSGGEPGLPRRLTIVHDRLASALAGLAERGVSLATVEEHASTSKVIANLQQHFAEEAGDDTELPAAADQQSWIVHHRRLLGRIADAFERVDLRSHTAQKVFFGDDVVYDELDDEGSTLHHTAYRDWYLTCHRAKTGRRTIAERLLAGSLPVAERCLLEARVAARTGLWVVATRRAPVVVLRDVFTDHEVEIHDGSLATSALEGSALPARIADANGHRFLIPLGPKVPPLRLDAALACLQACFGKFTSADLQRRPEMLGTLWSWSLDEVVSEPLRSLTNTAGDPLEPLIATFHVADWTRFAGALRTRSDVDEEDDDHWTWYLSSDGENTQLASLERVVDELLVEVNSLQRLAAVRAWLEAIPGVTFAGAREPDFTVDVPHGSDTQDLGPEALAQLQAHVDARTLRWLDQRVPALGDRTPREAVGTPEGRETVLRLIRSWPDPSGIPGLRTPRERLRRELGLAEPDAEAT